MVAQSLISSFFLCLPGGDRSDLSDVYFCGDVHCFKGIGDVSSLAMPLRYSLLQGSLTCFGVMVRSSVLKLY